MRLGFQFRHTLSLVTAGVLIVIICSMMESAIECGLVVELARRWNELLLPTGRFAQGAYLW